MDLADLVYPADMSHEIACPGCDLLVDVSGLEPGQSASCPRCDNFLTRKRQNAYERVLAFGSAGLMFLVLANSYPFLSFSSSGLESVMTLQQTPGALWANGMPEVGVLVAAFIIFIPAAVLLMMVAISIPLSRQRSRPWVAPMAKAIFLAENWSMVEVFIIGVIVSLVKIAAMATVVVGLAFWAYVAFTVCFTMAIANLDRYQCWEDIETLGARQ